jgi:hypothetical protein
MAAVMRANDSGGHVSVRVEGKYPAEIPFLFEQSRNQAIAAVKQWKFAAGTRMGGWWQFRLRSS